MGVIATVNHKVEGEYLSAAGTKRVGKLIDPSFLVALAWNESFSFFLSLSVFRTTKINLHKSSQSQFVWESLLMDRRMLRFTDIFGFVLAF